MKVFLAVIAFFAFPGFAHNHWKYPRCQKEYSECLKSPSCHNAFERTNCLHAFFKCMGWTEKGGIIKDHKTKAPDRL